MSDPKNHSDIEQLLEQALDLPLAARERFLDKSCGDDTALRARLEKLLALADTGGGFLERSPLRAAESSGNDALPRTQGQPIGHTIGPYRIERLLGAGGMGEVYLAERIEGGFRQRVALKLVRRDVASAPQHFDAERQILADLEHPGIARLYDGGISADGQPYMAMEFVEGRDLLAYCAEHKASLEQRLSLFLQVCEAVSYAHAHLVVHRDLKPANIFVTVEGRTKLLDFGIAKLLQPNTTGDATRTAHLSPAYAAPEQLTGASITTATDVYALGATLFQLLTGRLPWLVSDMPLASAVQRLLDEAPPRLSTVDHADAPVPSKRLRGDLDAIVAKALRKEPRDRYPDARALSDDLWRYLKHEPVQARLGARTYVVRRFLRRHWLPLSAAALVFIALIAGIAGIAWQAQRAEREATLANATKDFLISVFRASDPRIAQDQPREQITAKQLLDMGAARIENDFADQPELQIELLGVTAEIYEQLPDDERFVALQKRRMELARAHYGPEHPIVIEGLLTEIEGKTYRQDYAGANQLLGEIDALLHESKQDQTPLRARWWRAKSSLLYASGGNVDDMAYALDQAIALFERLAPQSKDFAVALANRANIYNEHGDIVQQRRFLERALAVYESMSDPNDAAIQAVLSNYARNLEVLGDFDAAKNAYERAEHLAETTYGKTSEKYWLTLAYHARLLHRRGERKHALELFSQMLEAIPPDWKGSNRDAWARGLYAGCLSAEGRAGEAIPLLEVTLNSFLERDYSASVPVWRLALGDAYDHAGRSDVARDMLKTALDETLKQEGTVSVYAPIYRERWGRFLLDHAQSGDADLGAAEAEFRKVLEKPAAPSWLDLPLAHAGLARIRAARGDNAGAISESRLALTTLDQVRGVYDLRVRSQLWLVHSALLLKSGDAPGARSWAQQALAASRLYDDASSPAIADAEAAVRVAM